MSSPTCKTCNDVGRKPVLICTYGHAVVWGGAVDVSWDGESCNYRLLCGARLRDSGKTAPCPDCTTVVEAEEKP